MLNRHTPWHALKKYTEMVKMGQGARAFPARAPTPFLLFSVASPIVTRRLVHAVATLRAPGIPRWLRAEDFLTSPPAPYRGRWVPKKNPASFRARGLNFRSRLHRRPLRHARLFFFGSNLGGLRRPIRTEIRAHEATIGRQSVGYWE